MTQPQLALFAKKLAGALPEGWEAVTLPSCVQLRHRGSPKLDVWFAPTGMDRLGLEARICGSADLPTEQLLLVAGVHAAAAEVRAWFAGDEEALMCLDHIAGEGASRLISNP
jgi:hypothetical protein